MSGGTERRATRRTNVGDHLHGVWVPDPYRWLEDGDSSEVREWVADQNAATREVLDGLADRAFWHERLLRLLRLPAVQAVQPRGPSLILLERLEGAQQASLVIRSNGPDVSRERVLVDPADGADDGAVAIDWFQASRDGGLVAFGVSEGGTEDSELRVVRSADGVLLDDQIPNCRAASVAWEPDGGGFFYTRYPEGDQYHRSVFHHRLGADPRDDPVVWAEHPTPETWPSVDLSADGRWLLVQSSVGWSRTDVQLLDRHTDTWTDVIVGVDAVSSFRFDGGDALVGVTTVDAPRGRLVRVPLPIVEGAGASGWVEVVPERDVVLTGVAVAGDGLVTTTSSAGVDALERWDRAGSNVREVTGVGLGSIVQLAADPVDGSVHAIVTGFDRPTAVVRVGAHAIEAVHPLAPAAGIPELTVSQVEYPSADGTSIGLFLIHRDDVEPGPDTPTILNGYGGFAITESPMWSAMIAAWCAAGGQYAIAGLRGGFEHGDEWHRAGRRERKQNVFDDFHAAADWLVDKGRTSRDRLAITGGSNGGLLVGAALTQRPDLCRAVWCAVPLLDMIRFPRFLIARLWTDEYGDPDVADEFDWLWAYSPYHHVVEGGTYPAILLTTAEGDSRVDPLHARKMAAMLQWAAVDQNERPVLLFQEGRAGHGVGKPVGKRADEQADVLAFLSWQLGFAARGAGGG